MLECDVLMTYAAYITVLSKCPSVLMVSVVAVVSVLNLAYSW